MDDNEDARVSLSWLLKDQGYEVWEAGTAREALRLARRRPDLVVLDVVLPDQDGFEVCRRLKADPETAPTPVLMLSGYAVDDASHVHALEGGADAYLTKPAPPSVLLAHAKALLRVRRAEEEARAARAESEQALARMRAVVSSMGDGLVVSDPAGNLLDWNPAALRMHGFAGIDEVRRHLSGFRRSFVLSPPGGPPLPLDQWPMTRVLRGETLTDLELHVRRLDTGRELIISYSGAPVRGPDGRIELGVLTLHDATARRRLEEQFRQAQKMEAVGRLAAGVAHDFNNQLTAIIGLSDVLLELLPAEHPARDLVNDIHRAGERSAGLTRQLLAFSRQEVIAPRAVDLNEVIQDVSRVLGRVIGEDVRLVVEPGPGLLTVRADPGQLEQVLMNLAVNARDAMPTGGTLTVRTANARFDAGDPRLPVGLTPGRYVVLAVADNGSGMTAEVKRRLFEPFFTTKEVGKGTGLGLAVVHGIVTQAGGAIEVDSTPGRGTTILVYLPVATAPAPDQTPPPRSGGPPRGTETVLLVEDEEAVRVLTRHVLRSCGYEVLEAAGGAEAARAAASHPGPIHLLVTDVVMPDVGGRELAERLVAERPGMKVLYLSGYTDDAVVRHGVERAEVDFLEKPYSPAALARKVRDVLDRKTPAASTRDPAVP